MKRSFKLVNETRQTPDLISERRRDLTAQHATLRRQMSLIQVSVCVCRLLCLIHAMYITAWSELPPNDSV